MSRWFYTGNVTWTRNYVYDLEYGLHEMLLQSPHRTLDPEVGIQRLPARGAPAQRLPSPGAAASWAAVGHASHPPSPTNPPFSCRKPTFSTSPRTSPAS